MIYIPVDQPARDRIETQIDTNMCVEAGAGTGKTTILVSRIKEIIRTGYATIDSMVVITFTEKAAAELATRVRESLEKAYKDAVDEEERNRYDDALRGLYRARIETIHAFASSLLRERPIEARLDPNFDVLDALRADLTFDERFRVWINEYLNTDGADYDQTRGFRKALNRGFQVSAMRSVCEAVHNHRYILPLAPIDVGEPDVFAFRELLREGTFELQSLVHSCVNQSDKSIEQIEDLQRLARRVNRAGDNRHRLERILLAASLPKTPGGNKTNWDPKENCDRQKEIRKHLFEELDELQANLKASALASILPLAEDFVQNYAERRRNAGQAEFEDLLIWARDLLRDEIHVRRDFQNRFKCLLVDEFQDTDPLQVEIVMYLASDGQDSTDWTELRPTPGKLFVVGDPKQSIYRFRRADIAIYQQVKEEILNENIEVIRQNFRSVPGVIDWVNGLFRNLIEPIARTQPEYIELDASLTPIAGGHQPVVVVHSREPAEKAEDIRREEARLLASTIRHIVEDATWLVRDPDSGEERRAEYRDIAILLPTRTGLEFFEDAFSAARIPFRHEGGKEYFQRQEIRDLRACLRAIDNPGDRLALVAALRSSAFGCSDEHLFGWFQKHGTFDYRVSHGGDDSVVAQSLAILEELHDARKHLTLPEIVERTIERTNLVEYALTLPNGGDQTAGNLLKMVDQARAFSAAQGGGLRAFVRWTVTSSETRSDESDAAVAESTDDVVRLMTIHGAKGLEFPIVALANLYRGRGRTSNEIPNYAERRLDLNISGFQTLGFEAAKEYESAHDEAEQLRLFYVAATRASDYLVLPIGAEPSKAKGLLKHLIGFVPALTEDTAGREIDGQYVLDPAVLPPLEKAPPGRTAPVTDAEVVHALEERRAWFRSRDRMLEKGNIRRRIVTASSQKTWERPAGAGVGADGDGAAEPLERNSAIRIGNALHGALERIDLCNPVHVRGMVTAALREAEIPPSDQESEARVRRMVQDVLASDLVARIQASTEHVVQEVEFGYGMDDGGLAQGQMDVIFVENGEIIIGDFKSDNVSAEGAEQRTWDRESGYFGQAAVYAYAAHQITRLPVKEVIFYYAAPNVAVSIPGSELMDEGERRVEGQSAEYGVGVS